MSIEEETEDGKKISSKISVPMQVTCELGNFRLYYFYVPDSCTEFGYIHIIPVSVTVMLLFSTLFSVFLLVV